MTQCKWICRNNCTLFSNIHVMKIFSIYASEVDYASTQVGPIIAHLMWAVEH